MLCYLFGIWCASAAIADNPVALCPQKDITAYELALMITHQDDKEYLTRRPELMRHTARPGECKE